MPTVLRPVVRSFRTPHEKRCAEWVKAGGHAVFWDGHPDKSKSKASLVQSIPDDDNPSDLSLFSMLDLGEDTWDEPKTGPFRGLAVVSVPKDAHWIIKRRAERDAGFPAPKHRVSLDCLACGTCCTDNEVILEPQDLARFEKAGRPELAKPPLARKSGGKIRLTLIRESKRCHHLGGDNRCGIYKIRPDSCSSFPVASECCIYARENERSEYDGIAPGQ
jgi:uncharacterized protein